MRRPPTGVRGSTRSTVHLPPRAAMRAPGHDRSRSPSSDLEGQGRRGRGLLVGGMWHLRLRLAGAPLRRGERRVTTTAPAEQSRDNQHEATRCCQP